MKRLNWSSIFNRSAIVILVATAAAKLASVGMDGTGILKAVDPVLFIPNRMVLIMAAVLELGVAGVLLFSSRVWLGGLCCAMLGTQFLLYRAAFQLSDLSRGGPCLGTLVDWETLRQSRRVSQSTKDSFKMPRSKTPIIKPISKRNRKE